MEGAYMRHNQGAKISLSEKEMLDCLPYNYYVPNGTLCDDGGSPAMVYDWEYQTGTVLEQNYKPYNAIVSIYLCA